MAVIFKVNGRDLSAYLQLQHSDGFDPVDGDRVEPQFAGSLALGDGQMWVQDASSNKEWHVPLFLKAASVDVLHQLIRDIRGDLVRGVEVEFRPEGASESTFFDLEAGRLEEKFEYFIARAARLRTVLRLWTRPHGHTGTWRTIASALTRPTQYTATGVLGDVDAEVRLRVQPGPSQLADQAFTMWAVARGASYEAFWPAPSIGQLGGATLIATSSALGTGVWKTGGGVTASESVFTDQIYLTLPTGVYDYKGRARVFGIFGVNATGATLPLMLEVGDLGAGDVRVATYGSFRLGNVQDGDRALHDFGEVTLPASQTGLSFRVFVKPQFATAFETRWLHFNALVLLPVEHAAGIVSNSDPLTDLTTAHALNIKSNGEVLRTASGGGRIVGDWSAGRRGGVPVLPALGSPMPSGPAKVIVLSGPNPCSMVWSAGNSQHVTVEVRERFRYFR